MRPPRFVVVSHRSLRLLAGAEGGPQWFVDCATNPLVEFAHVRIDDAVLLVGREDDANSRRILLRLAEDGSLLGDHVREQDYSPIIDRLAQFSERSTKVPLTLPHGWGPYTHKDRYAFAAAPKKNNRLGLRFITRVDRVQNTLIIWGTYRREDHVDLGEVAIDDQRALEVLGLWTRAVEQGHRILDERASDPGPERYQVVIEDFDHDRALVATTYDEWMDHLTDRQREFLENDTTPNLELSGPAGSGKTLMLELKALRTAYQALDSGKEPRILIATHSWTSADSIDRDLQRLDHRGGYSTITVFPLSALAAHISHEGLWLPEGMELLGDDSYESKNEQIDVIDRLLKDFLETDWITYESQVSDQFRERVTSTDEDHRRELVEDLLMEFGCVFATENIFRGREAQQRYLTLPRLAWMMPLEGEADRSVVFAIYQMFLEELLTSNRVTVDVMMAEFFSYLQGFKWDSKRRSEGFDLVIVDEAHLFNIQERMALRYLMSSPDDYPRVCVAKDARQSPRIRREPTAEDSEEASGGRERIELDKVHRYSPEILALIRHIYDQHPAWDLGEDPGGGWRFNIDAVESSAAHGPDPVLYLVEGGPSAVETQALRRAQTLKEEGGQTALLVVEDRYFESFVNGLRSDVTVISGRDDLLPSQLSKRSLVVAVAEHVAGLQFTNVVVAGLPDVLSSESPAAYRLGTALSLLYLAASRAEERLEIFHSRDEIIPSAIQTAIDAKIVVEKVP